MTDKYKKRTQGFTLVELSIVIIIIGFLIAGVSAGQSLIRQAALNSVITDFQMYQTAYNNFVGRYGEIPGDMVDGMSYWGTACDSSVNNFCNGNGDGVINMAHAAYYETFAAWKELSLAGMIVSLPGPVNPSSQPIIGVDSPASRINNAGYSLSVGTGNELEEPSYTMWHLGADPLINVIMIGTANTIGSNILDGGVLSPIESFNIDQKIDDGNTDSSGNLIGAGSGILRTFSSFTLLHPEDCLLQPGINLYYYNPNGQGSGCVIIMAVNQD